MHLRTSLALAVCFQATLLQALCTTTHNQEASGKCVKSHTNVATDKTGPRHHTMAHHRPAATANHSPSAGDRTRAANETRVDPYDLDTFRLEYNKYKILSHLSITKNLDGITPRIDEDLRYRLLTSPAFKESTSYDMATSNSRRKRSLTCAEVKPEKDPCCMDNFYINFTQIGWDKWILYPPGYQANYCRGKCDLSHARYYHSTLLSKYSHIITLCCSPKSMASLNMLYIDEDNKVHQRLIPDMIVESCDCA